MQGSETGTHITVGTSLIGADVVLGIGVIRTADKDRGRRGGFLLGGSVRDVDDRLGLRRGCGCGRRISHGCCPSVIADSLRKGVANVIVEAFLRCALSK